MYQEFRALGVLADLGGAPLANAPPATLKDFSLKKKKGLHFSAHIALDNLIKNQT